jgi:pyridinium-3,5-bisthiocarboxylic acid mononucleotide nickel chelatase
MTNVLFVDPIGGAAGDMLLSALLDAGAPVSAVRDAVEAVLPGRFVVDTDEVVRGGMRARLLRIEPSAGGRTSPRPLQDLLDAVERSPLLEAIRDRARAVLIRLGEAESRIHGGGSRNVLLHDLGDDDTLLDVVGVCAALEALSVRELLVGSVPLAVDGAADAVHWHGGLPPSATLELLTGFRIRGEGKGETVTPTAAAILSALGRPTAVFPEMIVRAVGYGAGTRDPGEYPNVVRVVVGEAVPATVDTNENGIRGTAVRMLSVLEANLDDLSPELVADAVQALLSAGALDVWTTPIQMKKGRPGVLLSALCEPEREAALLDHFFRHTSTFGVRISQVRRAELERRIVTVPVGEGTVRVKVGLIGGTITTITPEHDDVAELARTMGRPVKAVYEEAATAARDLR